MENPVKGKCLSMYIGSNVIIMENMDVYEIYREGEESYGGIPPEDYKGNYHVRKLPMKTDIDFKLWYGDDGKANWYHERLPVFEDLGGLLHWDY